LFWVQWLLNGNGIRTLSLVIDEWHKGIKDGINGDVLGFCSATTALLERLLQGVDEV
jgi:hypothetical protein